MLKKTIVIAALLVISLITVNAQTDLEQLKDDYIRTFNPEGYAAYSSGQSVKQQGLSMARDLSSNLDSYGELIRTMDPVALLSDFNQQIQDIENLQAQYNEQSNSYDFQTGQDIGNSINAGDFDAALNQFFGALDANEERKAAERQLQAKKDALYQQRRSQMTEIYWKAVAFNNSQKEQYLRVAAFSEFKKDEEYYLAFAKNLDCFNESMDNSWSSAHSDWLINRCAVPQKNSIAGIENTFVSKDVSCSNIAKRKYKYFQETAISHYREAAISFAAKAAKINPSAKYFYQIGTYYDGFSTVLALSNYSVANYYDSNFLTAEQKQRLEELKKEAEEEIKYALETNNQEFINAFINAKLNKIVRVDNKSLLTYAISLDQADAVQIILNKDLENSTQAEKTKKVQQVIMLCAVENSPKTIKRIVELGVSLDFEINNLSPLEISDKVMSIDAYFCIADELGASKMTSLNTDISLAYKTYNFLYKKQTSEAVESFKKISETDIKSELLLKLFNDIEQIRTADKLVDIFPLIDSSPEVADHIKGEDVVLIAFFNSLKFDFPSKPYNYIKYDLVSADKYGKMSEKIGNQLIDWNYSKITEKRRAQRIEYIRDIFDIAIYYRQDIALVQELLNAGYIYDWDKKGYYSYMAAHLEIKEYVWTALGGGSLENFQECNNKTEGALLFTALNMILLENFEMNLSQGEACAFFKNLVFTIGLYPNYYEDYVIIQSMNDYLAGIELIETMIQRGLICGEKMKYEEYGAPSFYNISESESKYWKSIIKGKYEKRFD